ncbi:hypothetical protein ACIQM3_10970 [Streptomyces sp. NPDC091271]
MLTAAASLGRKVVDCLNTGYKMRAGPPAAAVDVLRVEHGAGRRSGGR